MRCHHVMLELMVLMTCLGKALTDHCECDESSDVCDNIHICYHCEFREYTAEDCLDSYSSVDLETCRTNLIIGTRKQALYIQATSECLLISKPETCTPRYSETVDVVFLKTCAQGCTNYTITKHENSAVAGTGIIIPETSSNKCQDECFPLMQDCTVSHESSSETCTKYQNCGKSCLTSSPSSEVVYTFTCNQVACPTLSDPLNGAVDILAGNSPGALAKYSCMPGYNLTGSSVVKCDSNGQWNDSIPSCSPIDCGIPAEIEFGSVSYTETKNGANATYTCDTGHNISEPSSRSCQANGSWELPEPKCVPVDCGPIPNLDNGTVDTPEGTTFGEIATFSCDDGFVLFNGSFWVCQEDSQWSGKMPSCELPGENAQKNGLGKLFIMPCLCYPNKTFVGLTEEEIIQQLIADTKIEKNTKLAVSKLISKPDPRVSSKIIGSGAIVVLSIIGGLILCCDIITIRANRRALED